MALLTEHDADRTPANTPGSSEPPLPWLGHAYPWPQEVVVLCNKVFGPVRRHRDLTAFAPREFQLAAVEPRLRVAFLGDLLPGGKQQYLVGERLRAFLNEADYLVVNLEGVIAERSPVFNALRHEPWVLDFLADVFPPEGTVVLCANNHAADCGASAFDRFYGNLREQGFRVVGRCDEPAITLPEGVRIANGTEWLNVRRPYVSRLDDAAAVEDDHIPFRIFCPHWGIEMALYPSPAQVDRARRLLNWWDMIVGHHPHCPQPIAIERQRLVAYSLGNFARGDGGERGWHGAALRVSIGPDATGQWRVGETHWTFTRQSPQPNNVLLIDTADTCRFFDV